MDVTKPDGFTEVAVVEPKVCVRGTDTYSFMTVAVDAKNGVLVRVVTTVYCGGLAVEHLSVQSVVPMSVKVPNSVLNPSRIKPIFEPTTHVVDPAVTYFVLERIIVLSNVGFNGYAENPTPIHATRPTIDY